MASATLGLYFSWPRPRKWVTDDGAQRNNMWEGFTIYRPMGYRVAVET